jgi:hypothetical protein
MMYFWLVICGFILGVACTRIPYFKKSIKELSELSPEDENIISQIIYATQRQNDLFQTNKEFLTEHRAKIISLQSEKASNYNNLIFTLGYATLFAVITFLKDKLPPEPIAIAYMLALFSVVLFIGFSVYNMWFNMKELEYQIPMIKAETIEDFYTEDARYQKQSPIRSQILIRIWYPIFFLSLSSGIGSALVLFFSTGIFFLI